MLQNKKAVIYGATGSLGSVISKAFAAAGATVFLTGRNETALTELADNITNSGGKGYTDLVDAMERLLSVVISTRWTLWTSHSTSPELM